MVYFLTGFLSTLISIIVLRPFAFSLKLTDTPDARKKHIGEVPVIGGISVSSVIVIYLIFIDSVNSEIEMVLFFSLLILILGIYDDLKDLRAKIKLSFQLLLVTFTIYFSGIKIESLGFLFGLSIPLDLGLLAIPFSIISVIGLTNAFNMIDGFDGQAGLLSVIAIMGIFMFGLDKVDPDLYNFLTLFLSGLIAFLIFNFTNNIKMKIFLGDGGSLLLGFIISFILIYCSQILKLFSPSFALWCVCIPLFDFFTIIALRKIKKQKLLIANKDHIHDFLDALNFSKTFVTFLTSTTGLLSLCLGYYLEVNFPSLSFWIFLILFKLYLFIRIYYEMHLKNII